MLLTFSAMKFSLSRGLTKRSAARKVHDYWTRETRIMVVMWRSTNRGIGGCRGICRRCYPRDLRYSQDQARHLKRPNWNRAIFASKIRASLRTKGNYAAPTKLSNYGITPIHGLKKTIHAIIAPGSNRYFRWKLHPLSDVSSAVLRLNSTKVNEQPALGFLLTTNPKGAPYLARFSRDVGKAALDWRVSMLQKPEGRSSVSHISRKTSEIWGTLWFVVRTEFSNDGFVP